MPRHPPNALTTLNRSHCQCSSSRCSLHKKRQQTGLPFTTQSIQQCHRRVRPDHFIGATPSSSLVSGLKTSFSRLDPIPRGQATVIRSSVRCSPKTANNTRQTATRFTLTIQSDKLPSYLQSLHHIRPARPSMGSQELGSDALGRTQNTWKPPDQSSLHDICRTGTRLKADAKLVFLQKTNAVSLNTNRFGGAERDRTADPLLAKQVLSQLSYSPISSIAWIAPGSATFRISHIPSSLTLICWCKWWAREDLNFRPHAYQACALTN